MMTRSRQAASQEPQTGASRLVPEKSIAAQAGCYHEGRPQVLTAFPTASSHELPVLYCAECVNGVIWEPQNGREASMTVYSRFGALLKRYRQAAGLSQEALQLVRT